MHTLVYFLCARLSGYVMHSLSEFSKTLLHRQRHCIVCCPILQVNAPAPDNHATSQGHHPDHNY